MERLYIRVSRAVQQAPLDPDYLEFVCAQEMFFLDIVAQHIPVPGTVHCKIKDSANILLPYQSSMKTQGKGRPKISISREYLQHLVEFGLPMATISSFLGVSRATLYRIMAEDNISVRGLYSACTDPELDALVSEIKTRAPHSGYRSVKGILESQGHRVQWERVRAAMHRVDSLGVLERMTQLGCVVRRTFSVPCSNKLIRYIVIFGAIDGFSRKSAGRSRGGECWYCPFDVFHVWTREWLLYNWKKIERLWRDVWMGATNVFYHLFHMLEEEGLFDLSNITHFLCLHYVFLPRLQASLDLFQGGWDNHPLRTEQNLTPNQLWEIGQMQHWIQNPEDMNIPEIDWEESGEVPETDLGVNVPQLESPLTPEQLETLKRLIDPLQPSESNGVDIYLTTVQYIESLLE
ncbi:hypothetical protein N1851_027114 [Merluccius polli]|uniref:Integrase core domain-containing protein n=1 Tax=Merluccius polli TaxID=89951 RepID=A0AA47MAN1_MERPO|nr:hypothetical protein N1851_027114 [Merluccius polli]